ncbi:MAG: hypothetical protein OES46_11460 [Gammaproteobacteria bacterium]|nr:hypothetical protein [Gammaproteobacteria bacterium]
MGRKSNNPTDLPPRLHYKGQAYYYVTFEDEARIWTNFGRDRERAVQMAEQLNAFKRQQRIETVGCIRRASREVRELVFGRDGHRCAYCGSTEDLGLGHFIPFSQGGSELPFNMVVSCGRCQMQKGDQSPQDFILEVIGVRDLVRELVTCRIVEETGNCRSGQVQEGTKTP